MMLATTERRQFQCYLTFVSTIIFASESNIRVAPMNGSSHVLARISGSNAQAADGASCSRGASLPRDSRSTLPSTQMNNQTPRKPHIVFYFSDTGGGHRSAAEAIIEAIHLEYDSQVTTEMVDFFKDYAPRPFNHADRKSTR